MLSHCKYSLTRGKLSIAFVSMMLVLLAVLAFMQTTNRNIHWRGIAQSIEQQRQSLNADETMKAWTGPSNQMIELICQDSESKNCLYSILRLSKEFAYDLDSALSNAFDYLMPFSKVMAQNMSFKLDSPVVSKSTLDSAFVKWNKNRKVQSENSQDLLFQRIDGESSKTSFNNLTSVNILYDKTSDDSPSNEVVWTWEENQLSEIDTQISKIYSENNTDNEGFLVYTFDDNSDKQSKCNQNEFWSAENKLYASCIFIS